MDGNIEKVLRQIYKAIPDFESFFNESCNLNELLFIDSNIYPFCDLARTPKVQEPHFQIHFSNYQNIITQNSEQIKKYPLVISIKYLQNNSTKDNDIDQKSYYIFKCREDESHCYSLIGKKQFAFCTQEALNDSELEQSQNNINVGLYIIPKKSGIFQMPTITIQDVQSQQFKRIEYVYQNGNTIQIESQELSFSLNTILQDEK